MKNQIAEGLSPEKTLLPPILSHVAGIIQMRDEGLNCGMRHDKFERFNQCQLKLIQGPSSVESQTNWETKLAKRWENWQLANFLSDSRFPELLDISMSKALSQGQQKASQWMGF